MNKRATYLLGGLLILAFGGFALASFRSSLTQYVSYQEARATPRTVQVAGGLDKGSTQYDNAANALLFTLAEPETGEMLRVRYHGIKPANFEDAVSIVAIGHFDSAGGVFAADKLLVKCPSKYQGAEVEQRTYS